MAGPAPPSDEVTAATRAVVGDRGIVTDAAELAPHLVEMRGLYRGATPMLVRPGSTEEVTKVVALCAQAGVPIVPQGGNTSLCGGRSEGRRVGKECVRTCRSRGSPYHTKTNHHVR